MKTLTVKLPEILEAKLNALIQKTGQKKSTIVRRALAQFLSDDETIQLGSFLDLSRDLAGSIKGPSDLSVNKARFEEYGQ